MELKITKERVLDAASKCSTAEATLKILFPEAFENVKRNADDFKNLEKLLDQWINYADYSLYLKIKGNGGIGKAKNIIKIIKKTYEIK